jgi:hypothetical protein
MTEPIDMSASHETPGLQTRSADSTIRTHTRGEARARKPEYSRLNTRRVNAKRKGDRALARDLQKRMHAMSPAEHADPGYRRLRYIRYADLCRGRHKSAYAEVRVMPTGLLEGLPVGQVVVVGAA